MTIFISHSSAQKAWVERLAHNLKAVGELVFFDRWHLVPGQDYPEGLQQGLNAARAAVVVVSPEAWHSGWVKAEINTILAGKGPGFPIIPVVYGAIEGEFPFLAAKHRVDFRPPTPYRAAFASLLCGLRGVAPGAEPWCDDPRVIEPPTPDGAAPPGQAEVCRKILTKLDSSRIVSALARDGVAPGCIAGAIAAAAGAYYPNGAIRHLASYWLPEGEPAAPAWRQLAADAGLDGAVDSAGAFQEALLRSFNRRSNRRLWLITGFEALRADIQDALAKLLRAATDNHAETFKVVFCGAGRLNELKYRNGGLSVLSSSVEIYWPHAPSEPPVDDPDRQALDATGGHAGIAADLLEMEDVGPPYPVEALMASQTLWSIITQLAATCDRGRLHDLAAQPDLGPAAPYLTDPALHGLFWRDLIKPVKLRLVWRSEPIRQAVAALLPRIAR